MKKNIFALAALLIASATFVACSSDDSIIETQQPAEPLAKTYNITIQASKGDGATTRALAIDGNVLNATWAEGEAVTVYNVTKSADLSGTLTAQSSGASTTLKGTLTGTIEAGDVLKLKFLSPNYASQEGTLEYIAANCDYAEASVTVKTVADGNITINEAAADFQNQQAIVRFTLKNKNGAPIYPTELTVYDGTNYNIISPASATNVLYVALPATSTVKLSTTIGDFTYSYEKTGASLVADKYYEITVKMTGTDAQNFNDPQGTEIGDPAVIDWLRRYCFTQADINALGNDYIALDKFYDCYMKNCDFRVEGAGMISLGITDITYDGGGVVSTATVQLVRKAPLGAIHGKLYFYGKNSENGEATRIVGTSVSFGDSDETFDTAPTAGELTQYATATFSDISAKFIEPQIHAEIPENGEEPYEPEPDPEE